MKIEHQVELFLLPYLEVGCQCVERPPPTVKKETERERERERERQRERDYDEHNLYLHLIYILLTCNVLETAQDDL